jgi:two-component system CheB/CheR fusion protein
MNYREFAACLLEQFTELAVVHLNQAGEILHWSAGAEKVFGYAASEVLGRSAAVLFTPEDRDRGSFELELAVARAGGNMEDDRWMFRKDGQRVWVSGVIKELSDDSGQSLGFAKIMRNRTDLEARTQFLETEVESLRRRESQRHQLFGTLAHELRNPLAPLFNVAHLLRQTVRHDEQVSALLGILDRQLDLMRKLIDNLLDVTRTSQGKVKLDLADIDLGDLLTHVVESSRSQLESRRHRFWLLLPAAKMIVRADAVRLHQVFANLLDNASKYTPPGGRIYLRATIEDDEALVAVEDNGVGISSEMLPRIFDLFTQEDDHGPSTRSGLGIGLALVKDLVSLHGGSVQARSDGRGKGSIFYVRLPLGAG